MGIGLVADIPDEFIFGGIKDFMQGDGQFDGAQIGGQVSAIDGHDFDDPLSNFWAAPTRDGTCVRDYIHVADLAAAHVLALGACVRAWPGMRGVQPRQRDGIHQLLEGASPRAGRSPGGLLRSGSPPGGPVTPRSSSPRPSEVPTVSSAGGRSSDSPTWWPTRGRSPWPGRRPRDTSGVPTGGDAVMTADDVADGAAACYADRYGGHPEGIWYGPGRVNLIGEHTDYNDGFALPFALGTGICVAAGRATTTAWRSRPGSRATGC